MIIVAVFAVAIFNFGPIQLSVDNSSLSSGRACVEGIGAEVKTASGRVLLSSQRVPLEQYEVKRTELPYPNYQKVFVEARCYGPKGSLGYIKVAGTLSATTLGDRTQSILIYAHPGCHLSGADFTQVSVVERWGQSMCIWL